VAVGALTFEPIRPEIYAAYALGRAAAATGGTTPTAFNAANEVAVELFLAGKIRFGRIARTIERVLQSYRPTGASTLEAVLAADGVGIQVLRFSLGFGRPIVSFRSGETEYWISWIPFGGYVKMAGVEDEGPAGALEGGKSPVPVDPARAFDRKPLWARFVVVLAGVTMNAVFAFAVYSGLAFAGALGPESIATTQVD